MKELDWLEELEKVDKELALGQPVPTYSESYKKYQFKKEINSIKKNINEEIALPESGEYYSKLHSNIMQQIQFAKKIKDQKILLQKEKVNQSKEKYDQAKLNYSIGI